MTKSSSVLSTQSRVSDGVSEELKLLQTDRAYLLLNHSRRNFLSNDWHSVEKDHNGRCAGLGSGFSFQERGRTSGRVGSKYLHCWKA